MQSLNRKILLYLLALWGGVAIVGAIGYLRLNAVREVSQALLMNSAPSAEAALQVESAIHQAFKNTYVYCTYKQPEHKTATHKALSEADEALATYHRHRMATSDETYQRIQGLVEDVQTYAQTCIQMTDDGMTPEEFETHLNELGSIQVKAVLELREAAVREQAKMVQGAEEIDHVVSRALNLFILESLLLLLVTLGVGYLLSRSVLPPVSALTRAAERFSAEDLSVRTDGSFPGEFGVLARAFNAMAARIQKTLKENVHLFQKVEESREKFRDLYDNAPDGYHSLGPDGTFLEINNTELEWLGYTRDEVVGRMAATNILTDSSRQDFTRFFEDLKRNDEVADLEAEFKRKDGTTFSGRINSTAVCDDQGHFLHSRATVRDISKEQELRRQLLQAQKLESLGTLTGGIAHDFNNLLTSIIGFTQLALLDFEPGSRTHRNLERVALAGDQAAGLVRQLLTFSRKAPSEKHPLSLAPLVKETVKVLERTLPETIQVSTDIVPDASNVEADATQIQQVLMNLSVNARDAMPDGGTLALSFRNVELDAEQARLHGERSPGPYVCLSVKDTGTGIPDEVVESIFEPFFTTKGVGEGTGLGLSIVHGIVESHGGHIHLDTAPGKGTEFQIYLPAVQEEERKAEEEGETPGGTETLLLVEDDPDVREVAVKMLEGQGYRVLTASDGDKGLEIYRSHWKEIDLVITDVVMPGLGGIDLSLKLAQTNPEARVLLISGYNQQEGIAAFPTHDAVVGFLQKPFNLKQVASAVREALVGIETPV